jgi:hypothetical protein
MSILATPLWSGARDLGFFLTRYAHASHTWLDLCEETQVTARSVGMGVLGEETHPFGKPLIVFAHQARRW